MKGTKFHYDILIENGNSPNCCNKWDIKLGGEIDLEACFTKTKKERKKKKGKKEFKLKWFQTRILATNNVLKEIGMTQSVLCDFCNLERDSLQHCMGDVSI